MRFPNTRSVSGYSIPMITELVIDANVQFLDQDDDDGKFFNSHPPVNFFFIFPGLGFAKWLSKFLQLSDYQSYIQKTGKF